MNIENADVFPVLNKDMIRNLSIINFMQNYPVSFSAICGNSVIVKGKSDKVWTYFSSGDEREFKELLKYITPEDKNFAVLEQWMLPLLPQYAFKLWELRTIRFYLPDNVQINPSEIPFGKLYESDAPFILENSDYKDYLTKEYIAERISNGPSIGIKHNGKLVTWAFTHDDGAIGGLHTLEEYRGRGFAAAVMKQIISDVRNNGKLPYAYVVETNTNSLNLLNKMNFVKDRIVSWFEIP